jgi:hypothetical protein
MSFRLDFAAGLDPETGVNKYELLPKLQVTLSIEFWDEFMELVKPKAEHEELIYMHMIRTTDNKPRSGSLSSDSDANNNNFKRTQQIKKFPIINVDDDADEMAEMKARLAKRLSDNNINNNFNNFENSTVNDATSEEEEGSNIFGNIQLTRKYNDTHKPLPTLPEIFIPPSTIPILPSTMPPTVIAMEQTNSNGDNTNTILAHLTAMFRESTAQTERKLDQFHGNLQTSIDDQNSKTNKKIQVLEDTMKISLSDHTNKIEDMVMTSNKKLKQELNLTIEDRMREGNETISQRIQDMEQEHKKQSALVHKLLKEEGPNEKNIQPRIEECRWNDLVADEAVIGWQEEYTQALTEATKRNGGTFTLPSLSRKIELGIKHATQRMKAGDLYPPQPVRDAETTFFQQRLEVRPSTQVGDGNLGVFTLKKVRSSRNDVSLSRQNIF